MNLWSKRPLLTTACCTLKGLCSYYAEHHGPATPEALARAGLAWLDDAPRAQALVQRFTALHHSLRQNTAQKATDAIVQVLQIA